MPQEFVVLRCSKCLLFQVHLSKKSPKWECKVCEEKQSIKGIFFSGTGKDCRRTVQQLNLNAGQEAEHQIEQQLNQMMDADGANCYRRADEHITYIEEPLDFSRKNNNSNSSSEYHSLEPDDDIDEPMPKRSKPAS